MTYVDIVPETATILGVALVPETRTAIVEFSVADNQGTPITKFLLYKSRSKTFDNSFIAAESFLEKAEKYTLSCKIPVGIPCYFKVAAANTFGQAELSQVSEPVTVGKIILMQISYRVFRRWQSSSAFRPIPSVSLHKLPRILARLSCHG